MTGCSHVRFWNQKKTYPITSLSDSYVLNFFFKVTKSINPPSVVYKINYDTWVNLGNVGQRDDVHCVGNKKERSVSGICGMSFTIGIRDAVSTSVILVFSVFDVSASIFGFKK